MTQYWQISSDYDPYWTRTTITSPTPQIQPFERKLLIKASAPSTVDRGLGNQQGPRLLSPHPIHALCIPRSRLVGPWKPHLADSRVTRCHLSGYVSGGKGGAARISTRSVHVPFGVIEVSWDLRFDMGEVLVDPVIPWLTEASDVIGTAGLTSQVLISIVSLVKVA